MDRRSSQVPGIIALALVALVMSAAIKAGWSAALVAIAAVAGMAALVAMLLACLAAGYAQADPNRSRRQLRTAEQQLD